MYRTKNELELLFTERALPGYQDLLDTLLESPKSEEAANLLHWVGGEFDAELFDKRAANAAIVRMMYNRWGGK